jgi:beta-phosphoglucomutase-like phosphatase (HAD superfamily)
VWSVTELKIRDYFQAEAEGATLKGKPDPAVFLLAAKLLGVDPHNCLVIEDSIAGVQAAKSAGCQCVAVLTTNPASALTQADLIVKDLSFLIIEQLVCLFDLQTHNCALLRQLVEVIDRASCFFS